MKHDDDDRPHSASDRDLGMDRPITRRDFLNGVAIGVGGALSGRMLAGIPGIDAMLAAAGLAQDSPGYYPPALTGMRGSHDGSYDVSHALRDGKFWTTAGQPVSHGRDLRSGRRRRRHQRPGGGVFLSRAHAVRAHPDPRQPRRLRRARQAERVPARRPAVDRERRHRQHRVALSVQQGSAQPDARAGSRSGRALRRGRSRRRPFGLPGSAERDVLRQGDLRRRSSRRRHTRRPWSRARRRSRSDVGGVPREDTAVARSAEGHRAPRDVDMSITCRA